MKLCQNYSESRKCTDRVLKIQAQTSIVLATCQLYESIHDIIGIYGSKRRCIEFCPQETIFFLLLAAEYLDFAIAIGDLGYHMRDITHGMLNAAADPTKAVTGKHDNQT